MVYKWGVINRKASMIHEFMYPHEAWFASWNIQDLSSSLSLCENLKISKNLCSQNNYLKSSLLYTWHTSLLNSVHELWARPPPPLLFLVHKKKYLKYSLLCTWHVNFLNSECDLNPP